jgi:hypothetical protein
MPAESVKKPRARSKAGAGSPNVSDLQAQIAALKAQLSGQKSAKKTEASPDDAVVLVNLSKMPLTVVPADGGNVIRVGPGPVKDDKIEGEYEPSAKVLRKDVTGPAWDAMVRNREIEIRSAA